ncbi:MAG: anhydro-N-acetylmuramic acid kinase [Flavobacterium sp.]|uniref:anhydro-N-acetylmuramic acid kinase n=1 Tax=Flavobacterium sp. TaxID=239 RepID=UPI003BA4FEBC
MFKESYHVIGVMSGTSLDGIDLAQLYFSNKNGNWTYKIGNCQTVPYNSEWLNKLKVAVHFTEKELQELNNEYTDFLGNTIKNFIEKYKIEFIDAVCSHGHTILHQPQNRFTLQIGNLPKIAKIIGHTVICDFRVQDVKLGGQGAPLVPIGDRLLFSDYDFCLNLGGFSNVSFEENGVRIAFDICPVNTVLNYYVNQLVFDYDDKGEIARSGKVNQTLLVELNSLDFYQKKYPKSLGIEFVNSTIIPLINCFPISIEDKLHTFVEHIAIQIAVALSKKDGKMLVTGGGAYHVFLLERMKEYLPTMEIIVPDANTLEFKEALIFGLLGVLKLRNEINTLSSVTGSKKNHSSGMIYKY